MLHYIKIPNLIFKTWIDFSNWKPTELQKSPKGWIVNIYKNKISQDLCSTVTINKQTILEQKKLLFWKNFHFWQWLIEYSVVLILTSSTWCSALYFFLFIVHHLSTFKHCFCIFWFKHHRQFSYTVFCSYCFVILTSFLYSWHCVYSLQTVRTMLSYQTLKYMA